MTHRRPHVLLASIAAMLALLTACSTAASPGPTQKAAGSASEQLAAAPTTAAQAPRGMAQPAAVPAASPAAAPAQKPQPPVPVPTPGGPADVNPRLPIDQSAGRMVIYTTDVTLLVQDLSGLPDRLGTIAVAHGGYVANVETRADAGVSTVVVRLKVPPQKYDETMRALRGLAVEVRGEKAATQDVTEDYSDTQAQIASLEATHAQLLELMKRSGSVDELLKVQQQAGQVKLQIDRLKGHATALERTSELATITATGQLASDVLRRDYVTERTALRNAQASKAALELQLKRARSAEEEASLRDRLGELQLEVERRTARLGDLAGKASAIGLALPSSDDAASTTLSESNLGRQYVDARMALRKAQAEQEALTAALRRGGSDEDRQKLADVILRTNDLTGQLKAIQDRANQLGVTLPTLTAEQESVMSGVGAAPLGVVLPAQIRQAWDASLQVLLAAAGAVVFLWWVWLLVVLALVAPRSRVRILAALRRGPPTPAGT